MRSTPETKKETSPCSPNEVDFFVRRFEDSLTDERYSFLHETGEDLLSVFSTEDRERRVSEIVELARAGDDVPLLALAEHTLEFLRKDLLLIQTAIQAREGGEHSEDDELAKEVIQEKEEEYNKWEAMRNSYILHSKHFAPKMVVWDDVVGWMSEEEDQIYAKLTAGAGEEMETLRRDARALNAILNNRAQNKEFETVEYVMQEKIDAAFRAVDFWILKGLQSGVFDDEDGGIREKIKIIFKMREFLALLESH